MDDVHINIDNYNPKRNSKILIVFDNIIADINTNKKFKPYLKHYLLDAEKCIRVLYLSHNLIFFFQKRLD